MALLHSYVAPRCDFGKQPLFNMGMPQLLDSIVHDPLEAKKYILRNPVHQLTQNTPPFSHNEFNTMRVEFAEVGANHAEGGWPKDVNVVDAESTQRYRRKIEKDDAYISCVMKSARDLEHFVLQNNAVDMYQTYYAEIDRLPKQESPEVRTVNLYRDDPTSNGRPISSICWRPDGSHYFAVSHLQVDFNRTTQSSVKAHIWDVENSNGPLVRLEPPGPMLDLQYNPREQSVLAGALINGQVVAFDERTSYIPTQVCPKHVAHRDAVRSVLFINAKSGTELFSAGMDGAIKWWDLRNFSKPIETLCLDIVNTYEVPSMARAKGASTLEFEPTIPTRFMVGTEDGEVVLGNRKGKTFVEKLPGKFHAHLGPVWALHRNPGFLKNFLTVGDWTARVWSEDCRESAILWTPPDRHCITDGAWSPTRLSLVLLAKENGVLALWDLLKRQHEPLITVHVCSEPLAKVAAHEAGALLVCGTRKGDVYLLELSANLAASDKHDKALMTQVLEREAKRERILEARMREIKLKQRQAEDVSPAASLSSVEHAGDADLDATTAEYHALVKRELAYF